MDAFADDDVRSDENAVADCDRGGADGGAIAVTDGAIGGVERMEVGVENLNAAAEQNVIPDADRFVCDNGHVGGAHAVADRKDALRSDSNARAGRAHFGVPDAGPKVKRIADRRLAAERYIDGGESDRFHAAAKADAVESEQQADVTSRNDRPDHAGDGLADFENFSGGLHGAEEEPRKRKTGEGSGSTGWRWERCGRHRGDGRPIIRPKPRRRRRARSLHGN